MAAIGVGEIPHFVPRHPYERWWPAALLCPPYHSRKVWARARACSELSLLAAASRHRLTAPVLVRSPALVPPSRSVPLVRAGFREFHTGTALNVISSVEEELGCDHRLVRPPTTPRDTTVTIRGLPLRGPP